MNIIKASTKDEQKSAFQLRMQVFVEEQHVPADMEIDTHDQEAAHFIGLEDEKVVAAGRTRIVDDYGKLERICVLKNFRNHSFGRQIIAAMENDLAANHIFQATLHAQTHAIGFYKKLGYKVVSGEFMDAGIPHVSMVKQLSGAGVVSSG